MAKVEELIKSTIGWIPPLANGANLKLVRSKGAIFNARIAYMILRAMEIFEWKNLPETMDARILELYLLTQGYAIVYPCDESNSDCKVGDKDKPSGLYVLAGGLGGQLDASYFPTLAIPVSPYLNLHDNGKRRIGQDCAIVRGDANCCGVMPLFSLYGGEQAEAFLTLRLQLVNLRTNKLIQADNDTAKEDAKTYLKKVDDDGELGVIGGKKFFDMLQGIDTKDFSASGSGQSVKDTIEAIQFLDGKWFNELGLNANFNMKREAINEDEVGAGEDTLFPLIDDMLKWRKAGADAINSLFGTNIEVDLKSSWKREMEEREITLRKELAELKEQLTLVQSQKEALENAKQDNETPAESEATPEAGEVDDPNPSSEEEPKEEEK